MKSNVMNLFGGFSRLFAESKFLATWYSFLPSGFKTYDCFFIPTFSQTNITKTVDIPAIGRLCGNLREIYGLKMMPFFRKNVEENFNTYVLKTVNSSFLIYNQLRFGQKIKIKVAVSQSNESIGNFSLRFSLSYRRKIAAIVEQEIFYINTCTDKVYGEEIKKKVFQAIRSLDLRLKPPFDLMAKMKFCSSLKNLNPDHSFVFRWDLRSCTEEGNTNHASFLEYLMTGVEEFLIKKNVDNLDKISRGELYVSSLSISYLKDFRFFQNSVISFFFKEDGTYDFVFKSLGQEKSLAGGTMLLKSH